MFIKKYGDIIVGCVYGAIGIALIVAAKMLPSSKVMEIGPEFMPTVIGSLIVILSAILLVQTIVDMKKKKGGGEETIEKDESDYKRVFGSLILSLLYVSLLQPVGFIICTLVYLFCQIFVLAPDGKRTKKDIVAYVILDIVFTIVVYFLFRYGFKIVLPAGIFGINI